ncbi:hypothetical protein MNEG_9249, partial [Monoraphidium neglectum]
MLNHRQQAIGAKSRAFTAGNKPPVPRGRRAAVTCRAGPQDAARSAAAFVAAASLVL